jgi:hypothetical protein
VHISNNYWRSGYQLWLQVETVYHHVAWLLVGRYSPIASRSFQFGGKAYPYFLHPYNRTWYNERSVEISIFQELIEGRDPGSILEVGNVMSHYVPVKHDVLDRYERFTRAPTIRQDLTAFNPEKHYDLIISISTIEHIGWDEGCRRPEKSGLAIARMRSLLAPGGCAAVSIPAGYNSHLDEAVRNGSMLSHCRYLKRVSRANDWIETDVVAALGCRYGFPYPGANGLTIGFIWD